MGQLLVEIDLVFVAELIFLLGVSYPGYYCVLSYLGYGPGCKSSKNLLPHLQYVFSVYKAMNYHIKYVSADGEKGFAALTTEIQEMAGTFLPLPTGDHPCFVDIKVRQLKDIMRCIVNSVKYKLPRQLLLAVAKTAEYFVNYTPCSGNSRNICQQ